LGQVPEITNRLEKLDLKPFYIWQTLYDSDLEKHILASKKICDNKEHVKFFDEAFDVFGRKSENYINIQRKNAEVD
jgi:hypothetical protein